MSSTAADSPLKAFDDYVGHADTYLGWLEEARLKWVANQLESWRPLHSALMDALERARVPGSGYAIAFGLSPEVKPGGSDADGNGGESASLARRGDFHIEAPTRVGELRVSLFKGFSRISLTNGLCVPQDRDCSVSFRKGLAKLLGEEMARTVRPGLSAGKADGVREDLLAALDAVARGEQQEDDVLAAAAALLARDAERRDREAAYSEKVAGLLDMAETRTRSIVDELVIAYPEAAVALFGDGAVIEQSDDAVVIRGTSGGRPISVIRVRPSHSYSQVQPLLVNIQCIDDRVQRAIPSCPGHEMADDIRDRLSDMADVSEVPLDQEAFRASLLSVLGMIARVAGDYRPGVVQEA